jgi:putative membrane protein
MKQTIQGFLLAGTLVLGGAALAQDKAMGNPGQGKGPANKGGTTELRGFIVPNDEKAFLERLHYTNQKEIKLGQLAQQNGMSQDVKSFGEMMVRDHTAADQKLMTMAQGMKLKLADMPKPLNDVEKKVMAADKANQEKLQAMKGEAFDSCYMSLMVGDHDETLGKVMAGQQALSANTELTTMLGNVSQSVTQHRQQAYSVLGKLNLQGMGVGGTGDNKGTGTMGPGSGSGSMGGTMDHGAGGAKGTGGNMGSGTGGNMGSGTGTTGSGSQQPTK